MPIVYTQIKIGHFDQFFTLPVATTGHLVSDSFCVQLWKELEPKGLILQPAQNCIWTTTLLGKYDIPIISLALQHYDVQCLAIIHCCRMYLHIIPIFDMLIIRSKSVHPEYIAGHRPSSRSSTIAWPPIPRPPKTY
jgi:hypothetical protein